MKTIKSTIYASFVLFIIVSCKTVTTTQSTTSNLNNISLNGKVYSAVWQQNSGEFRALCYQAYNLAKIRIDEKTAEQHTKPFAIITDIDETFLDNSPYAVTESKKGKEYDPKTWNEWCTKAAAVAYPGSLEFFNYAKSKNVTVFYVTNRNEADKPGTLKNISDLGFPFSDNEHLIVMTTTSDKEERRKNILKDYEVILYLGDNLGDFSQLFYKKPQQERNAKVDELSALFGDKFIVLPNSGYGDWEPALPGFNYKLSPKEKDDVFLKNLRGY